VELTAGGGGVFNIEIDGVCRYAKRDTGRFPTDEEISDLLKL